jgi:DNA-binding SARP family transcriptional activator
LEVRLDGQPLQLHGLQERAVLGVLLSQRNRVVSVRSLIGAMWGADPPPTAKKTLQSYVSRLRGLLEPDRGPAEWRVVVTKSSGYCLDAAPEAVDAAVFDIRMFVTPRAQPRLAPQALGAWPLPGQRRW